MSNEIPIKLISLIHHVELNKSGWYEKAIENFIISGIWLLGNSPRIDDVTLLLKNDYGISIGRTRANRHIRNLINDGILVSLPNNRIKICEEKLKEFQFLLDEGDELYQYVKELFISTLKEYSLEISAEETWELFANFLREIVYTLGVRIYELITLKKQSDIKIGLNELLSHFPENVHPKLTEIVQGFFNPEDQYVKEYILRILHSYFLIEATSLSKEVLEEITEVTKPEFDIFIDTNFIFSLLSLHDNPANEAAIKLLELIEQTKDLLPINLYVLPNTIQEAKRVLNSARESFQNIPIPRNLALAATSLDEVSGITRVYFESIQSFPQTPKEYFDYYINNLITLLNNKGVLLFDYDMDHIQKNDDVQYEISQQQFFEKRVYKKSAKTFTALEHDIIIWHAANELRPGGIESPAKAKYWIVTIDYRLLGFDQFKQSKTHSSVPLCIHPTDLIQLLNFWIARSPKFDNALFSSIRMPLLFRGFDSEAEEVCIQILLALARFEGIEKVSPEAITSILTNDALRVRIATEQEVSKQVELVKETITELYSQQENELAKQELELSKAKVLIDENENQLEVMRKKLDLQENQIQEEKSRRIIAEKNQKDFTDMIRVILVKLIPLSAILGISGFFLNAFLINITQWESWRSIITISSIFFLIWLEGVLFIGKKNLLLRESKIFNIINNLRKWIWGVLLLPALGNAVWDLIKFITNLD